jgi:dTDP-4-dehydrorhamnose 3,5-epimerase
MIDGVEIVQLKIIPDERGRVMHMMKSTDKVFEKFGEIYFSVIYPGVIKGWHMHKKMIINYAVPSGKIKLVLFDTREKSKTKGEIMEIFIGEDNYSLVKVPAFVWNGFKGIGITHSIVANCSSIPHDPTEVVRLDPFSKEIPYNWELKNC